MASNRKQRNEDTTMMSNDEPTCPSCVNVTLNDGYLCDDCAEDACPGCGAMPEEPHDRHCHA